MLPAAPNCQGLYSPAGTASTVQCLPDLWPGHAGCPHPALHLQASSLQPTCGSHALLTISYTQPIFIPHLLPTELFPSMDYEQLQTHRKLKGLHREHPGTLPPGIYSSEHLALCPLLHGDTSMPAERALEAWLGDARVGTPTASTPHARACQERDLPVHFLPLRTHVYCPWSSIPVPRKHGARGQQASEFDADPSFGGRRPCSGLSPPRLSSLMSNPGLTFSDRALSGPAVVVEIRLEDLDRDWSTFRLGLLGPDGTEKHVTKEAPILWVSARGPCRMSPCQGPLLSAVSGTGSAGETACVPRGVLQKRQVGGSPGKHPTLPPVQKIKQQISAA